MKGYAILMLFFISIFSYAQTDPDYLLVNKIIAKPQRKILPFLTDGNLLTKSYDGSYRNEEQVLEHYAFSVNELFADTLKQYAGTIDKQQIKQSFVKWDKQYIKNKTFTENTKNDFCYVTKPILLENDLFVVITFHECALGGVTACLYQYDKKNKSVKTIKFHTMKLNGFSVEW